MVMVNVGFLIVFPLFLQMTHGLNALQTGLIVLPFTLTVVVMVPVSVRFAMKFLPRSVVQTGWLIALVGAVIIMGMLQFGEEPIQLIPGVVIFAFGMSMVVSQMANFVMPMVKAEETPEAVNREIVTIYHAARENTFQITPLAIGFIGLVGLFLSNKLPRKSLRKQPTNEGYVSDRSKCFQSYNGLEQSKQRSD